MMRSTRRSLPDNWSCSRSYSTATGIPKRNPRSFRPEESGSSNRCRGPKSIAGSPCRTLPDHPDGNRGYRTRRSSTRSSEDSSSPCSYWHNPAHRSPPRWGADTNLRHKNLNHTPRPRSMSFPANFPCTRCWSSPSNGTLADIRSSRTSWRSMPPFTTTT